MIDKIDKKLIFESMEKIYKENEIPKNTNTIERKQFIKSLNKQVLSVIASHIKKSNLILKYVNHLNQPNQINNFNHINLLIFSQI